MWGLNIVGSQTRDPWIVGMFGPSQEAFHGCLNDDQLRGSDPQSRDYECTETCADDLDPGRAVLVMFAWDDICFLSYFVVTASLMLVFLNSGRERERERTISVQ